MKKNKYYYYDIQNDLEEYPDAWAVIVVGGRNTGKTYSALRYSYLRTHKKFIFMKRTMDDVDLICSGTGKVTHKQDEAMRDVDFSPFKSLNRDFGCHVQAFNIRKGFGGFWETEEGEAVGAPIGYILALNAVGKYKGFDLSDCDLYIFDEFIPSVYDRVNRKEGIMVLDGYKTISRDREHRGLPPLKLIALANATEVSNPLMNTLEITDDVVDMQNRGESVRYLADRGILIRRLNDNDDFRAKEAEARINQGMAGTAWARSSLDNEFAYNDFTNVGKLAMKGFHPVVRYKYQGKWVYIYRKPGQLYVTSSAANKCRKSYDLDRENDQKLFWVDYVMDLRYECMEGKMIFEKYSYYDLLINYKKFFKI